MFHFLILTHFFGYPLKLGVYVATVLELMIGVLELLVIFSGDMKIVSLLANVALILVALAGLYGVKTNGYYDYIYSYIYAQPFFIFYYTVVFAMSIIEVNVLAIIFNVPIIAIVFFSMIVAFSYYKGPPSLRDQSAKLTTAAPAENTV